MPREFKHTRMGDLDDTPFTCSPIADRRPAPNRGATWAGTAFRVILWTFALLIVVNAPAISRLLGY